MKIISELPDYELLMQDDDGVFYIYTRTHKVDREKYMTERWLLEENKQLDFYRLQHLELLGRQVSQEKTYEAVVQEQSDRLDVLLALTKEVEGEK